MLSDKDLAKVAYDAIVEYHKGRDSNSKFCSFEDLPDTTKIQYIIMASAIAEKLK